MVIDGVKEKYESLQEIGFYSNNSSFILCDCTKDEVTNIYRLKELIPLANGLTNIAIDRLNLVITDTEGKVLLEFNNRPVNNTSIMYANESDLVISNYIFIKPQFVYKKHYQKIEHYHLGNELDVVNTLFDEENEKLIDISFPNNEHDTYLIVTRKNAIDSYRLYSIKEQRDISPRFAKLEVVGKSDDRMFKFTDRIDSTIEQEGIHYCSNIIGFITIEGRFYNGVFDELSNREIECELNTKPDFEEYLELKRMIEGKLNEKVYKEANKRTTRDFTIKKLENRAKSMINQKVSS